MVTKVVIEFEISNSDAALIDARIPLLVHPGKTIGGKFITAKILTMNMITDEFAEVKRFEEFGGKEPKIIKECAEFPEIGTRFHKQDLDMLKELKQTEKKLRKKG